MAKSLENIVQENRLAQETSPYLLQHAHNPVNWYPWGDEALQEAKKHDKPLLVSIGYSSCHWCHVMEEESYENKQVAAYMNEHFVNIKVDREERPDLDQIYMEAVQTLTGHGGWPLNVFCTPDAKPFWGGTYFPPDNRMGRPSWLQILQSVVKTYREKKNEVSGQAQKLTDYVKNSSDQLFDDDLEIEKERNELFKSPEVDQIFEKLKRQFDKKHGGIGQAPKFPSAMLLQFLLQYGQLTDNNEALEQVYLSLDKMMQGGIYDHIGGGFARYSTDEKWLVPHFEKMLYDNALLVQLYAEAFKKTGNEEYKEVIQQTVSFIKKEMTHKEGGFYTALDADSEGEEGKYYIWDKTEIEEVLGAESKLFCEFYNVKEDGNWEGKNILHRTTSYKSFAKKQGIPVEKLIKKIHGARDKLEAYRTKRPKPGLDDKVLVGWNAIMCSGFVAAYEALQDESLKETAEKNFAFIWNKLVQEKNDDIELLHTYRKQEAKFHAFLDDYSLMIKACLDIYEATFEKKYLENAKQLAEKVVTTFYDEEKERFYYTNPTQKDVITNRFDAFDNATPSGNAVMTENLFRLAKVYDQAAYLKIAENMLGRLLPVIRKHPAGFGYWLQALLRFVYPYKEIAVIGEKCIDWAKTINHWGVSNYMIMADHEANKKYPLLKDKTTPGKETWVFVCENFTCRQPLRSLGKVKNILTN